MRRLRALVVVALALLGACSSGGGDKDTTTYATTLGPTSTDVTQPIEQLQMQASRVTDLLIAHKWADAVAAFSPAMKASYSVESLKLAWGQVETKYGAYKSRGTTTRVRPSGTANLVFDTPLSFAKKQGKVRITFDVAGQVDGMTVLDAEAA